MNSVCECEKGACVFLILPAGQDWRNDQSVDVKDEIEEGRTLEDTSAKVR